MIRKKKRTLLHTDQIVYNPFRFKPPQFTGRKRIKLPR